MIGYSMFGSNDLPRAFAFYDAVFASVGIGRLMEFPTGAVAWGTSWTAPMVAIGPPFDGKPATAGNGAMIAIAVDTRAKVDAMYQAALAAGGSDEGGPGVRGDDGPQAFYAAYFRDPDGNKLCAFRVGPA
ncbi:VOC family protein [Sandarakinorhabdus rubra]|uniref:VOC family protein n=1 Tax=Sandarakinorhabdus rubra TaxID=2672568 RepID=UPI0013D9C7D9|nr:VOC family protein [Sandarakinorhabdus rubra]